MTFAEKSKQQEDAARKEGIAGGSDWFKMKEGDNVFRILTEPEMMFEKYNVGICYTNCGYEGTPKYMCYIEDAKDGGKLKLAKLPYTVGQSIASYEGDEDWKFDGFPMPYFVKVKAEGAGTKEVKYTVTPSPKQVAVPEDIAYQLGKRKPVVEIIEGMKQKKKEEHVASGFFQEQQENSAKALQEARTAVPTEGIEYPAEDINPDDIPF